MRSSKTSKPAICYVIDALGSGGAQTHLISVLKNMDHQRYSICLVCVRERGRHFESIENLPIKTMVCDLPTIMNPYKTLAALLRVRRFLRANRVEILQSYMFNPNVMAGFLKITLPRIKLITTRRDMGYWHKKRHWLVYRYLNYVTNKVIAVSEQVKQIAVVREPLNPAKTVVIHNGLRLQDFDPQKVSIASDLKAKGVFTIGMLAVLRPEKRHDLLIQAAPRIIEKVPNVRFILAGGGYAWVESKLREQIKQAGLEEYFKLLGMRRDVASVLAAFDLSLSCSDSEGISNTLIESLAMAKPVIATDVGGNPEIVESGVNGFLVPPNNHESIADRIVQLATDSELRSRFSENARRIAELRFDIHGKVRKMEEVYEELLT